MAIKVRRIRGERRTVIVVSGAVDAAAVPALRRALARVLRTRTSIVVDLTQTTSICRAGLTTLVAAHRQAQQAGTSLLLRADASQVRTVLAVYGLPPEPPH
jgi:anti-anti-sigma factor